METGIVDVILFSINAAYDMLPASEDVNIFLKKILLKTGLMKVFIQNGIGYTKLVRMRVLL
ncbi:hypothetical protein [Clostridium psychrophilum]|uniref:hypothetical protein n=1 Tax=Clostridium psychrophilum TaxID=132926 RepID=UPI001FEB09B8|nr:hypothetical protein [Clostridium psychrophilum]